LDTHKFNLKEDLCSLKPTGYTAEGNTKYKPFSDVIVSPKNIFWDKLDKITELIGKKLF